MSRGAPAALVRLRNASVRYGARLALADADVEVGRGEFVAVVGPNGAGKTTLLRAIHGLQPLDAGERVLAPERPRIVMLFQRPFLVRMSVRANLELALWLAGVPRSQRREQALQALAQLGLADLARRSSRELSVGQQHRVALARALALQPDLLLLDEPTASLDPDAARDVEALIAGIARRGVAVLMTSHNLGQVRRLAARVIHMEQGRVEADVGVRRFFEGALPPGAARFLEAELPRA